MNHPHKSTTHEERFYHIKEPIRFDGKEYKAGTVFFRLENSSQPCAAVARCSSRDNFCRQTGRNVAKRRYFLGKRVQSSLNSDAMDISWYEVARQIYRGTIL